MSGTCAKRNVQRSQLFTVAAIAWLPEIEQAGVNNQAPASSHQPGAVRVSFHLIPISLQHVCYPKISRPKGGFIWSFRMVKEVYLQVQEVCIPAERG